MGNTFCCTCFLEQNEVTMIIKPELQDMEHVDALIAYVDQLMSQMDCEGQEQVPEEGQEQICRPNSVMTFINSGGSLIEKFSNRLKWHVCKKCLVSALDRETRKIVGDVLDEEEPVLYLGMALSVTAHLLERASSNQEECLRLLRHMSALVKHMKNLDIHLHRAKLDDILRFIVKGTFWCAQHMEASSHCRFLFAPLDAAYLENLEAELVHLYPDLQLQTLTEALNRQQEVLNVEEEILNMEQEVLNVEEEILNREREVLNVEEEILRRMPVVTGSSQGGCSYDAVGVESAENKVIELLDLQDESRRVVVIYGVGGIGKTTLVTAVCRRLSLTGYHHCSVFMDQDFNERDLTPKQEQILHDLFGEKMELNDWSEGQDKLSEAFRKSSKPVFLFIDNALRQKDLEKLLPIQHFSRLPIQSKILITTRSLNETNIFRLQDDIQVHPFRVDSLIKPEAKKVLCYYALGDKDGSFHPGVSIEGFLEFCGGIPLVLRIVGSLLRTEGNTVSACNDTLRYLKEWQKEGFKGGEEDLSEYIVDFVYRRLKEACKQAFLDIVFFFHNWDRNKVGNIVGEMELGDLEGTALITTTEENNVKVHDIVRARGKKLAEGNRITDRESLSILLRDEQKLQQIKGIWLDLYYDNNFNDLNVDLIMSRYLRVLFVSEYIRLNGRCKMVFEELRFLDISFENMLPIDLSKSKKLVFFRGHIRGRQRFLKAKLTINLPESLQFLFLDGPMFCTVSLDIYGNLTSLKELQLSNITLANFETCIGQLKSLRYLELSRSGGFTLILKSLGNFYRLELLEVDDCSMLERLFESFGNLFSLQELYMPRCSRFPESFGNLSFLQKLNMSGCSRFPDSFGNLSSLQDLNMSYCSMLERLPQSFGNLPSLQELNMSYCYKLKRLPESFGNVSSMQRLDMSNCSMLERLPESFGNLSCMRDLNINWCFKLEKFLESITNLSSLQKLCMNNHFMLETLPESFCNLSSLQKLYICGCSKLERLPDTFGDLSSLQELYISGCSKLGILPESFGNLASLQDFEMTHCSRLERLPESFGNLSSLRKLDMSGCSKLERLPEGFGNLSSLQDLKMSKCFMLERLPQSFGQLKCLKFLSISDCKELKTLPDDIHRWTSLAAVKAYGCALLETKAMDSLVEINTMLFLEMGESPMLIKRWEEIQLHRPLIGAALRFKHRIIKYRENYPYEEIMSAMFFNGGSRFLHLDGDGQLVEVASSSFPEVGLKVGLLLTASDLSEKVKQKLVEVASQEFQIIYVDVDMEGSTSSWMEKREKHIRERLLQLPEGSRVWTSPFYKTRLLFAYSLWHFTGSASSGCRFGNAHEFEPVDTSIVGTSVVLDGEDRKKVFHPLEMIFKRNLCDSRRVDLASLFLSLCEALRWVGWEGFRDF